MLLLFTIFCKNEFARIFRGLERRYSYQYCTKLARNADNIKEKEAPFR